MTEEHEHSDKSRIMEDQNDVHVPLGLYSPYLMK
jgi:hypothetical protein